MQQARQSRNTRKSVGFVGLFAFVITLIGVSIAPGSAHSPKLTDSIVGEYGVTLVRADVPTDLPDGYNYVGDWIIRFNEDGTYTATRQDVGLLVSGTWEVSDSSVTITDDAGLISCSNPTAVTIPGDDVTSGTYDWSRTGDELQLVPVDEGCGGRLLLLSTRTLGPYVPCTAQPIEIAVPEDDEESVVPVASPEASVDELLTPDDPVSGTRGGADSTEEPATAEASPQAEIDTAQVAAEIDALLAQMTACWSTGDPELWLSLLSSEFRDTLIASEPDFLITIQSAMSVPIIWERAGDVEVESATNAAAIVRSTVDQEQDFQRFLFVFEDGEWKWDG